MHIPRLALRTGQALLLSGLLLPFAALAAAPTVVSVTGNGQTYSGDVTASVATSSAQLITIVFSEEVSIPAVTETISPQAQTVTTCDGSPGAFAIAWCFTYSAPANTDNGLTYAFSISDAQNTSLETMVADAGYLFTVDTKGPVITITNGTNSTKTINGGGAEKFGTTTLSINGSVYSFAHSSNNSWTYVIPDTLADAVYTVTASSTDRHGNVGPETSGTLTLDTTAPPVTITSGPLNGGYVGSTSVSVTYSIGSDLTTVESSCRFDLDPITVSACPTKVFSGEGTHSYTIDANDAASNVTEIINTFTIDLTPPVLTEDAAIPASTSTTPFYSFFLNEATSTLAYGGGCTSTTTTVYAGTTTVMFAALAAGTYSGCTITPTDPAGNVGNPLAVTSFTIEALPAPEPEPAPAPSSAGGGVIGGPLSVGYQTPTPAPAAAPAAPAAAIVSVETPAPAPQDTYTAPVPAAVSAPDTIAETPAQAPATPAPATEPAPVQNDSLAAAAASTGFVLPPWALPVSATLVVLAGLGWLWRSRA